MTTVSPFEVRVYERDLTPVGWANAPVWLAATPRHNLQPTGAIAFSAADEKIAALNVPGRRVVVRYRGEHAVGGPVRLRTAAGSGRDRLVTFQITDDWWLLTRLLAWQVPGSAITAQSSAEYHVVTGPAETVVKTLIGAAVARVGSALGAPITIATDEGRGDTITVKARMDRPADVLFPLVDQAGIGVTVRQGSASLVVDCYEPSTWPLDLSEAGGTLAEGTWSLQPPEVTRVVLGAGGDGTARAFRRLVNTAAEAIWDVVEDFIDARDLDPTDPGFEAAATARMQAALAAGALKAGLSATLSETEVFRYGGAGVHVGDRLTVNLGLGASVTDVLRETTLTASTDDGYDATPVIGERRDDPDVLLGRAVSAALRTQRTQKRS